MRLQRGSLLVTFLLAGSVLLVYGTTVYTQQRWSQGYRQLQEAQRQERQMQTAAEAMKDQLAKQAEHPKSGLVPKSPETQIIVPLAPASAEKPNQTFGAPATAPSSAVGY